VWLWDLYARAASASIKVVLYHAQPTPFPAPWTVEEQDACLVVRDHNGQALAYVYFEDDHG
jgi:hypothetical protein